MIPIGADKSSLPPSNPLLDILYRPSDSATGSSFNQHFKAATPATPAAPPKNTNSQNGATSSSAPSSQQPAAPAAQGRTSQDEKESAEHDPADTSEAPTSPNNPAPSAETPSENPGREDAEQPDDAEVAVAAAAAATAQATDAKVVELNEAADAEGTAEVQLAEDAEGEPSEWTTTPVDQELPEVPTATKKRAPRAVAEEEVQQDLATDEADAADAASQRATNKKPAPAQPGAVKTEAAVEVAPADTEEASADDDAAATTPQRDVQKSAKAAAAATATTDKSAAASDEAASATVAAVSEADAATDDTSGASSDDTQRRDARSGTSPVTHDRSEGRASRFELGTHLGRSSGETSPDGATPADRVRFVQRVARAFQLADERGGRITLRLSPPELGSLKLEVQIADGVMRARLQAETQNARTMLLENLAALRERLAAQDIKVEQFDIDLMDFARSGQPQHQQQGESQDRSTAGGASSRQLRVDGQSRQQNEPARRSVTGDGQLNVIV